MIKKTFAPRIESIHEIQKFVTDALSSGDTDVGKLTTIELVIEEILSNIILYGFKKQYNGVIHIQLDIKDQNTAITIKDNGTAFNPLEQQDPDLIPDLDLREAGGLGIFFVRKLVKKILYSREQGWNKLTLFF